MQQANQPFHYTDDEGVDHFVDKGEVFGENDPRLKGREVFFNELPNLDKK